MRAALIVLGVIISFWTSPLHAMTKAEGYLFIIGGGDRPERMMKKFVELSLRNPGKKTIVFPMASSVPEESGQSMVEELKTLGLPDVEYHVLSREQALAAENLKILANAGAVYFTGGDQSRLTRALVNTPIHKRLLQIYQTGGVIGGTSAGAAVMSELMITGDEKKQVNEDRTFDKILADNIVFTPGFGFITTAINSGKLSRQARSKS